jgi:phage tail-like protein
MGDQRRTEVFGDHVTNFNFAVEIDGVEAGHFSGVDGLSFEQEVIEFQDGDDLILRKRPGRAKYGDITLKKGYIITTILQDWLDQARVGDGRGQYARKNMSIVLRDNAGTDIKRWNLFECFPKSWKMGSFDGKGNDVLTEEIVVVTEWFENG